MDKSEEKQMKRVFKRILNKTHEDLNREDWSPQAKDIILNASASQLLKEVTIRTYIK